MTFSIDVKTTGTQNYIYPSHDTELGEYYLSVGNTLYISKTIDRDNFTWYLPKINVQKLDYDITNLHPISDTEVAIFQKDSIRYVSYDTSLSAYRYYKSRVDIGLEEGSDVITTFDGKYTIFNTKRGLVAMGYQDFIASEEQTLAYISDTIYSHYERYITSPIKLCRFGLWLFVYRQDSNWCLLYDFRTNSWWPLQYPSNCKQFIILDNKVCLLLNNESLYDNLYDDVNNYIDDYNNGTDIDWFIKSQKLHLDAINYYKTVLNLTLNNTFNDDVDLDDESRDTKRMSFKFKIKLFRTDIGEDKYGSVVQKGYFESGTEKEVTYDVDCIATFVQRVNFSKVIEVQYEIYCNNNIAVRIPLSLANITIKYRRGSEVR